MKPFKDTNGITHTTYKEYLKSKHWMKMRVRKFVEFKKETGIKCKYCECCGKKSNICLHHTTYKDVGNETLDQLIYLCRSCHFLTHAEVSMQVGIGKDKDESLLIAHHHLRLPFTHKKQRRVL